jgi:hypothetical protein
MAQPLLPQEALRHRYDIYLSRSELAQIRIKAREARLPVSTFIRHSALAQPVQAPPSEVSVHAWQDMARVAGNLNQLAHAVASGRAAGVDIEAVQQVAEQVRLLRMELIGARPGGER